MSPRKAGEVSKVTEPLPDLHPERIVKMKAAPATESVWRRVSFIV
jgi:hypothetical protein